MATLLYALVENRQGNPNFGRPFYIGIGTQKRPHKHLLQSRSKVGHRNPRLHRTLLGHTAIGVIPGVVILDVFSDKAAAGEAEKAAIAKYGRIGIDADGILCNLACGGQGPDAELMRLPEVRERNAEAQRNVSPEAKAARIAALAANRIDPGTERRRRENSKAPQKASWNDPGIRARRVAAMKGKKKTPSPEALEARRANAQKANTEEARKKRSAASLQRWSDPTFVEQRSHNQAKAWQDPEKRARMLAGRSQGISDSWKNPETKARRIAGIKAATRKHSESDVHDDEPR